MKDDMELKRALDALPREIEVPADAWAGVRTRITTGRAEPRRRIREFHWPEAFEPKTIRIAAGIAAVGVVLTYAAAGTRAASYWVYTQWDGTTSRRMQENNRIVALDQPLHAGVRIVTGDRGAAEIHAGNFGFMNVGPSSELRMRPRVGRLGQQMDLLHGGLVARIKAPPGLIVVHTPIGTVTDMGCAYSLYVGDAGNYLSVTSGWVTLENHGALMRVPERFHVVIQRGRHAGTPVFGGTRDSFLLAVRTFDQYPSDAAAVAVAARMARPEDAVSLWHMLRVAPAATRGTIYDRLAQVAPPPRGVTRAGAMALDRAMLDEWWDVLPGAPHPKPSLHERAWLLWLKASSWL